MLPAGCHLRLANLADAGAIGELIALSARELSRDCYSRRRSRARSMAFLVTERQIRGVGRDALGRDVPEGAAGDAAVPRMPPGVGQLENLANLDKLPTRGATLVVAPLRIEAATAPARVIAILP